MVDLRRIVVIFVIAVLFSILVFSTIEAVYPEPKYDDYCKNDYYEKPYPINPDRELCADLTVPTAYRENCTDSDGQIRYTYDEKGCAVGYSCNTCIAEMNADREVHNMVTFIISAILGLLAVVIALYLPEKEDINEWIGTGFMLGGLFTMFFGTARYFSDMTRYLRPVVILLELLIVIYLTYKKLKSKPQKKK